MIRPKSAMANLDIERMTEVRQAKRDSLRRGEGGEFLPHVSSEKRLRAIWRNIGLPNGFCENRENVIIISILALSTRMWRHCVTTSSMSCVAFCLFLLWFCDIVLFMCPCLPPLFGSARPFAGAFENYSYSLFACRKKCVPLESRCFRCRDRFVESLVVDAQNIVFLAGKLQFSNFNKRHLQIHFININVKRRLKMLIFRQHGRWPWNPETHGIAKTVTKIV